MAKSQDDLSKLKKAIELLGFWACCFDYNRFTDDISRQCAEAEELLLESLSKEG